MYLFASLGIGLGVTYSGLSPLAGLMFPTAWAPLIRSDYNEIVRLINYLRDDASEKRSIYVAVWTHTLNDDLLRHAERAMYGSEGVKLDVLEVPAVNSRDSYPLEKLLQAQYVLIQFDPKRHSNRNHPNVVDVINYLWGRQDGITRDFILLPETFYFEDALIVQVYKRTASTTVPTALSTFHRIQDYLPQRPGGQLDWIMLSPTSPFVIRKDSRSNYLLKVQGSPPNSDFPSTLLYIGSLPRRAVLTGKVTFLHKQCAGIVLRLAHVDAQDHITRVAEIEQRPLADSTFAVSLSNENAVYILLELVNLDESNAGQDCSIIIDHFQLASD